MNLDLIDSLASQVKNYVMFKKGETLYREDGPCFGIHIVFSGLIKTYSVEPSQKEIIHHLSSMGDVLGYNSLLNDRKYLHHARAIEDSVCCFVQETHLQEVMEESPMFSRELIRSLGQQLNMAYERNTHLIQKNVRERLAEYFLLMGQRFGEVEEGKTRVKYQLTREEIASIIGTANETVSRGITEFKELGYVDERNKFFYILDPQKLQMAGRP